ncbi:MAG: AAA family ATPase [Selenomonadaceae bacterium]|nr:AAA family ATPase [Selenomonadaceae bacterium]
MSQAKIMPVGIDDFKKLCRENYLFVDKTRFIKELIDGHSGVTLITRPRRFGKTLTMSMVRYFFDLDNAAENRSLFQGLDIDKAGERYMTEQGTRPVVFISLKDVQEATFAALTDRWRGTLSGLYGQFRYLLKGEALAPEEIAYFQRMLEKSANIVEMQDSLKQLTLFLAKHYRQRPLLLIDEYDAPIIAAWEHGYYKECIGFMKRLLGAALKSNEYLDFALLTGVSRVSKESIFSDLNNLDVCSVLTKKYSDILGFTETETEELMARSGVASKMPEVKAWYDGYQFGNTEIYNPWSVIRYVASGCEVAPYWLNTSGNVILKALLERVDYRRQRELEGLLKGKAVITPANENTVYADIHQSRDALFMMLLTTGYLKAVDLWLDEWSNRWLNLQIPNKEISIALRAEILQNIAPQQGETLLREMLIAMTGGDVKEFAACLREILRDFVSYHDAAGEPENFYHGLMLGLTLLLDGKYRLESNRESGYGRFDLAFFPAQNTYPGVILELKAAKADEADKLPELAKDALAQIAAKEYVASLRLQNVNTIWRYGIAFAGKRVEMVGE